MDDAELSHAVIKEGLESVIYPAKRLVQQTVTQSKINE
jgi:hypothetical protein